MRKRLPSGSTAAEQPMLVACPAVRPPVDTIQAPPFPAGLPWVNVAPLRMDRQLVAPRRAEDVPGVSLPAQTDDQPGAYSGPYAAGGVWAVLDGRGAVTANGREIAVEHPGAYPLVEHERHTEGTLKLEVGEG